jgi:hypothetical protein
MYGGKDYCNVDAYDCSCAIIHSKSQRSTILEAVVQLEVHAL